MKMRVLEAGILFLLALGLQMGGGALRTQAELSDKLIRLHVLANSDASADQSLKLEVRDRILRETEPLLAGARSRADAEAVLRDNLPRLAEAARDALAASGCTYPVTLELCRDEFPTRCYGAFALPAGRYLSLRARIGDAAGQNWWCVVFPPLCGDASLDAAASGVLTADEISLVTRRDAVYTLKFRAVEYWEAVRRTLRPA